MQPREKWDEAKIHAEACNHGIIMRKLTTTKTHDFLSRPNDEQERGEGSSVKVINWSVQMRDDKEEQKTLHTLTNQQQTCRALSSLVQAETLDMPN